jgi:hypothetical protein
VCLVPVFNETKSAGCSDIRTVSAADRAHGLNNSMHSPNLLGCSHSVSKQTLFVDIGMAQKWSLCACGCVVYPSKTEYMSFFLCFTDRASQFNLSN